MGKRAKNLSDSDINQIVAILDGWSGSLTWGALLDAISNRFHTLYTRQALHRHARIKNSFTIRNKRLKESTAGKHKSAEVEQLEERVTRLGTANARLQSEVDMFLEQFARWAYNAHVHGMTEEELNASLPPVNRGRTKV
jgi:hypothetical protein